MIERTQSARRSQLSEHESAPEHGRSRRARFCSVRLSCSSSPWCWRLPAFCARITRHGAGRAHTTQLAAPTVIALPAQPGAPVDSFVLPGNVTA